MIITAILIKFDNGFNADVLTCSNQSLVAGFPSNRIMNRDFHQFPAGAFISATFDMTSNKRRMLKTCSENKTATITNFPNLGHICAVGGMLPVKPKPITVEQEKATVTQEKATLKPVTKKLVNPTHGYYLSSEARTVFTTAHKMSLAKPDKAVKIMMVGQSGYGKTTLPKLAAQVTGRSFIRMNCASIRDPEEWFGYREAKDGSTVFIRSEFARMIESGNCVVILDEFNRIEPWLHNTLFPLLDDDGFTTVHDELFIIGPNVLVVATINTGYKYTGTFELDEAIYNRFDFTLEVGPMPFNDEVAVLKAQVSGLKADDAGSVVKTANILRNEHIVCSTRTTLDIAKMVVAGMDLREAFEFAVIRRIPVDDSGALLRKKAIDLVNSRHSAFNQRKLADDVFDFNANSSATPVQVAPAEVVAVSFDMQVKLGEVFHYLRFIDFIKRMPLESSDGKSPLREAKTIADALKSGQKTTFRVTGDVFDHKVIEELQNLGLTGSYRLVHKGE